MDGISGYTDTSNLFRESLFSYGVAHETVCKTCESCMIEPCHKKYCFLKICCFQTRLKADCSATLTSLNNETLDFTRFFFLDEVTNVVIRLLILAGCSVHVV